MNELLEILARGALLGAAGAALMDVWAWLVRRSTGVRGLDYALLGRWIAHIPRGRLVTGGAMAPDGRWVVLRTYVSLHFFVRDGTTSLRAGSPPEGIPIPYVEPQGEGIAFDGPDRLILTSEMGSRGPPLLVRLRVVLPPAP